MNIAVITVGNELTSGRTLDTNTALIARLAWQMNWPMVVSLAVGDDESAIADALQYALHRAEAVIVTGGLGPTADDITTVAIARALGLPLYRDEAVLEALKSLFNKYHLPWTDNNAKQADFPWGRDPRQPYWHGARFFAAAGAPMDLCDPWRTPRSGTDDEGTGDPAAPTDRYRR